MDAVMIGKKLKKLRGSRTIQEVSKALGISPSTLGMYEIGARIPRDSIKITIANYYGKPVQDIFFAENITDGDSDDAQ